MDTTPETEKTAAEKPAAETPAAETSAAETPKKKSLGRRILKGLLWTIGGLLLFVIVALLTLPLWINPVGTSFANALVPSYTGTAFNLERLNLNPYTGKLLVSGVKLANPEGYAEKDAFSLGLLSVDVEVSSLLSSTIHVRDITISSPYASYVFDAAGSNNFDRIIAEVNKKLGPKEKKEKEPGKTKVVIDKVTIKDVRAAVGSGAFELATLTLTDFGKDDAPAKIEIAGVKLVNPKGFPEPDAFSLKSLNIGLETGDLAKKPMVFHDILVDSTYVGLVYNDAGESNFDVILKPFKGDEKKDEAASDEKKDKKKDAAEDDTPHVVIDKLDIAGTKVQYRKVTLPIPLPTFTDIGKNSKDGASMKEVADQVWEKAKGSVSGLGDIAGALGGAIGSGVTNLVGNAGAIVSGGVSNVLSGASNVLGGATSAISGGTSNVLSGAKGLLNNVLPGGEKKDDEPGIAEKAVEGAKNAGKAIGDGAKNLGEGAKGAVEGMLKKVPNPFGK